MGGVRNSLGCALLFAFVLSQGCENKQIQNQQVGLQGKEKGSQKGHIGKKHAQGDAQKAGKQKNREAGGKRRVTVFLDGKPIAALRYGELPLSMGPIWVSYGIPEDDGKRPRRRCFRLAEYIESLGLKVSKLNTIMLAAGRASRISHVTSQELLKHRDEMYFAFTGDTHGGVYMRYAPNIESNDVIDKLRVMYLYDKKRGPVWDKKNRVYKYKGKILEEIPHYEGPLEKGTRLYLGNRIHSILKKRTLRGKGMEGDTDSAKKSPLRVALKDYLVREGLDMEKIKRVDIIAADRLKKSFAPGEIGKIQIIAKPQSGGRVTVEPSSINAQAIILQTELRERPKPRYAEGPEA